MQVVAAGAFDGILQGGGDFGSGSVAAATDGRTTPESSERREPDDAGSSESSWTHGGAKTCTNTDAEDTDVCVQWIAVGRSHYETLDSA